MRENGVERVKNIWRELALVNSEKIHLSECEGTTFGVGTTYENSFGEETLQNILQEMTP